MKKSLIVFVALLTMAAFAGGAWAQGQTKPAAPAATEKPATQATEKPKAEKETAKAMKATGTVAAYEAGKMIKVKGKEKEMAFDLTADTQVKGEVKEGAKVTVMYKKDGDKIVATVIHAGREKKEKKS